MSVSIRYVVCLCPCPSIHPVVSVASGGAWPVGEGRKAPLVASDSSSSGGSDSEEEDKTAAAAAAAASNTASADPKKADLKRFDI